MITVPIDETEKHESYAHSLTRIKYEYDRFNLSLEQRISMILIGTLGQNIFKKFLMQSSINFEYEYQAGKYDDFDFKIGKKVIEIKTSGYGVMFKDLNLLYSDSQLKRGIQRNYNYCVLIFVNGYDKKTKLLDLSTCDKAVIAGFIKFGDIQNYKVERRFFGDDYRVSLDHLEPIEKFSSIKFDSWEF